MKESREFAYRGARYRAEFFADSCGMEFNLYRLVHKTHWWSRAKRLISYGFISYDSSYSVQERMIREIKRKRAERETINAKFRELETFCRE